MTVNNELQRLSPTKAIDVEEVVFNDSEEHYELQSLLEQTCDEMNLVPSDEFIGSTLNLADAIVGKNNIVICGEVGSGKSCVIEMLNRALEAGDAAGNICEVVQHRIAPMSLTHEELFGSLLNYRGSDSDEAVKDVRGRSEGVLPVILRQIEKRTFNMQKYLPIKDDESVLMSSDDESLESVDGRSENMNWVIFDGEPHSSWFDSMHDVFHMREMLLSTGERLNVLPPNETVLMIECTTLSNISPSVLSNTVVIAIPPTAISIPDLIRSYIPKLPEGIPSTTRAQLTDQVCTLLYSSMYFSYQSQHLSYHTKYVRLIIFFKS